MKYVAFALVLLGIYMSCFEDFLKLKNYYLGRYFNKVLGYSLVLFNMIALFVDEYLPHGYFDIIFPIIIGILLTKIKEKEFDYFLVKDNYYENKCDEKPTRNTVRGIVLNDKNEVAFIHLVYDDPLFEYRDHYELPGGGIEDGENLEIALEREIEEEIGYTIKDIHYLTRCGIEYNPFNRIDNSYIFVCHIKDKTQTNYQGLEKDFIAGVEFIPMKKLLKMYKENNQEKVGKMIYERDGKLIRLYNSVK